MSTAETVSLTDPVGTTFQRSQKVGILWEGKGIPDPPPGWKSTLGKRHSRPSKPTESHRAGFRHGVRVFLPVREKDGLEGM